MVHHAVFHASREGRAAEIAAWANATSALVIAAAVVALSWSRLPASYAAWAGVAAGVVAYAGFRLALAHRITVWIAAAFGTLTIAALGGALAWALGHVVESPSVPLLAAVVGSVLAALVPARSYAQLARRRAQSVRDSLFDPVSVPGSR